MSQFPHVRVIRDKSDPREKQWRFSIHIQLYDLPLISVRRYKTMNGAMSAGKEWVGKIQGMTGDG